MRACICEMLMNLTLSLEYLSRYGILPCAGGRSFKITRMQEHWGLHSCLWESVHPATRLSPYGTSTCIYFTFAACTWLLSFSSASLLVRKVLALWWPFFFSFFFGKIVCFIICSYPCFLFSPLQSPCLHACLPACLPVQCVWALWVGCLYACRVALTACGWCVCRCGSEQCCGCVGLARSGNQHVSPAQQRCHGSDLKHCPPPFARLPCKLGTAVTVSPSNPCVHHRGRHISF